MSNFNFDSFFNKSILNGSEKISVVVSNLSDEDFERLCNECRVNSQEPVNVFFDTGIQRSNNLLLVEDFVKLANTVHEQVLDAANKYSNRPDAVMDVYVHEGNYSVRVFYTNVLTRSEREELAVKFLAKRKSKLLAKKNKKPKEKKLATCTKTMVIDGVEYVLTPKFV